MLPPLPMVQSSKQNEPWYSDGLRFECTGCGQCCTGSPGAVWVSDEEIEKMSTFKGMTVAAFKKQYVRMLDGRLSLNEDPRNYDCVFLKDKKCTLYDHRPLQCRTFPWWPGVLTDKKSWKEAAKRCEGINDNAPLVSFAHIEKNAVLHRE